MKDLAAKPFDSIREFGHKSFLLQERYNVITRVRHTGIVVKDLHRSFRFYESLGFIVHKKMEESGPFLDRILKISNAKVNTVKMGLPHGGSLIELLHFPDRDDSRIEENMGRGLDTIGISHIAFTVADLEWVYNRLKSKGIRFNAPPQSSPDGYAKVTFCQDPDGNYIELVQVLDHPRGFSDIKDMNIRS